MSVRICIPSKEIRRAASYARLRAAAGVGPSAVTFSTRPPAVTISPSRAAVIARASSFSLGHEHTDMREAARMLGASHVLTGAVRRNGDAMRISAQLLSGRSGEILWSETFERPVSETLAVQDEIASRVARALRIVVPESAKAEAIDPRAFELYLRGRDSWRSGGSPDNRSPEAAIADLEEAVRLAPGFARAWAALASAYAQRQNWLTGTEQDQMIAKAISAASRALELDPAIGEAYVVLGRFEPSPDWAARGMLFDKAVAASPNDDEVLMLHALFWLEETGRMGEARRVLERAYQGDKMSELLTNNYIEALAATERRRAVRPGDGCCQRQCLTRRKVQAHAAAIVVQGGHDCLASGILLLRNRLHDRVGLGHKAFGYDAAWTAIGEIAE